MQKLSSLLGMASEAEPTSLTDSRQSFVDNLPPHAPGALVADGECPEHHEAHGCWSCHDARQLRVGEPEKVGDKLLFRYESCPKCCPVPIAWGVPPRLAGATFASFDLTLNRAMATALERCRMVASGEAWCAMLQGSIGVGKSHLAVAALNESVHEKPGRYWTWGRLLMHIRQQAFDERGPRWSEDYALQPFTEGRSLLVLDDVGAEKMTDWAQQTLYTVLNARYEGSLPTIVTTNNPDAIDDRVLSRYFEGTVICRGQDVRRRQTA